MKFLIKPRICRFTPPLSLALSLTLSGIWLSLSAPAWAWDFAGHLVMAQLAYTQLEPAVQAEAERLIGVLAEAEPRIQDFVPAAVWLDAQSWSGFELMQPWHFINQPYVQGPLWPIAPVHPDNIVHISEQALRTLANPQATDFQKGLMLRVLLHTVGDLHQPLHTLERYSSETPQGDRGGRDFTLTHPRFANLHALWDAAGGQYPYLQISDWQQAQGLAQQLQNEIPLSQHMLQELEPAAWAQESFKLGQAAYTGIQAGKEPSAAYLAQTQQICRQQLATAAYRLASLLNQVLR